jgi:auxin-responsive protein IAA
VGADDVDSCLKATELRLGLPGTEEQKALPTPPSTPRGKKRDGNNTGGAAAEEDAAAKKRDGETAPPAAK